MSVRFSKHKYDIKKRPEQNELSTHCANNHDPEKDLEVSILDSDLKDVQQRKFMEDRFICRLQTLQPTGMNSEIGPYGIEMYQCWKSVFQNRIPFPFVFY